MTGQDIIDKAREFIGTPWRHQGRKKGIGIDCVGLLYCVASELGIPAKDHRAYHRYPDGQLLLEILRSQCIEIPLREIRTGDILIFRGNNKRPMHAAFKTESNTIIHAWLYRRKVVETICDKSMFGNLITAFRFKRMSVWQIQ